MYILRFDYKRERKLIRNKDHTFGKFQGCRSDHSVIINVVFSVYRVINKTSQDDTM